MSLLIRALEKSDCERISSAFLHQGWHKQTSQYECYFEEQFSGKRDVLVACKDTVFAGYVTIIWDSTYPPFHEQKIPEIVDLNVLIRFQKQGIGSALMDAAESRIAQRSPIAGIGVGLTRDYGSAQIMYVKRGYLPDGKGISKKGVFVPIDTSLIVDDDLVLYLTRKLGSAAKTSAINCVEYIRKDSGNDWGEQNKS